jgi:hypothetical protein
MQWISENLVGGYELVGDVEDQIVRLAVKHSGGEKTIKVKHMSQNDINEATTDDFRRHFSRIIDKIRAKTPEQLELLCKS